MQPWQLGVLVLINRSCLKSPARGLRTARLQQVVGARVLRVVRPPIVAVDLDPRHRCAWIRGQPEALSNLEDPGRRRVGSLPTLGDSEAGEAVGPDPRRPGTIHPLPAAGLFSPCGQRRVRRAVATRRNRDQLSRIAHASHRRRRTCWSIARRLLGRLGRTGRSDTARRRRCCGAS